MTQDASNTPQTSAGIRAERRAAALRENLKRRKMQARGRARPAENSVSASTKPAGAGTPGSGEI